MHFNKKKEKQNLDNELIEMIEEIQSDKKSEERLRTSFELACDSHLYQGVEQ